MPSDILYVYPFSSSILIKLICSLIVSVALTNLKGGSMFNLAMSFLKCLV